MAFRDQMKKFIGRFVRVNTVDGTLFGRMIDVKSTTIILRIDDRRIVIRNSKIVAVTEHEGRDHDRDCDKDRDRDRDCDII
ncbi:DUF2642 domain-containing protein [Brevibacillus porteri]|uniref:DUF2642 domain-containing protein n=1 Tax=Brevibacillus brevis TaxID=1393 RepID=A0A517I9P6_BREBE|nr:DUF2642 domain-containing protein [Brevibacillus brevis]QDS35599.1 DUF2642 domain-containing protein [Brevibacillus brevis]